MIAAGAVILFDVDLSLEVIAALLTLIGYSINDTIIIFDRIRETMSVKASNDLKAVVNEALSATLSRTIANFIDSVFCSFNALFVWW